MSDNAAELKKVVEQQMSDWQVPGIAVGILRNGETETYGFGVASEETRFPMRPHSSLNYATPQEVHGRLTGYFATLDAAGFS